MRQNHPDRVLVVAAGLVALTLVAACGGRGQDNATMPAGSTADADDTIASAALADLFDEHFEKTLELNPLMATRIGDDRFNDRLAITNSPEYRAAERALDEEYLNRLLLIDRAALDYQDQLSYDMFRILREQSLEGTQYPSHLQPINQFYSLTNSFVRLGSGASVHPFETVDDYDDFLSRVDDFVANVDWAIENMKEGMRKGVVQPEVLMVKVVPQLESQIVDDVEDSLFWRPVENMPAEFEDSARERLTAAYRDTIMNTIIPTYERLNNFIGDEYLSAARDTVGLGSLPNGTTGTAISSSCGRRPI